MYIITIYAASSSLWKDDKWRQATGATQGRHGGRHWRYFYQLHKEGKLEAEYERVIGSAYFEALRKDGFIIPDVTIPNFFKNINS